MEKILNVRLINILILRVYISETEDRTMHKKYEKWEEKKYKKRSSDWISEVDNKEKIQELILE